MDIDRVKLKKEAKRRIKDKVFNLLLANIIVMLITAPVNGIPGFGQIISIAVIVVQIGLSYFYLNFIDYKKTDYSNLFFSFTVKDFNTYLIHLGTLIVKYIFIVLWSLLFIIPGIIKAIAYSQVTYLRAENPEMDIMDCLKESEKMMKGHKMDYFVLSLSFLGWLILCGLTFGILFIYVLPYYTATITLFYRKLRPKDEQKEEVKQLDNPAIN